MTPKFECIKCDFKTKYKGDFKRHLKTNKHLKNNDNLCSDIKKNMQPQHKTSTNQHKNFENQHKSSTNQHKPAQACKKHVFFCDYCNREFKTQDNLTRHIKKYCKSKKKNVYEIDEIQQLLAREREAHKLEKERLYSCIDKLIEKAGNTTNITNNTQNNIHLNNYGSEDLSHISDQFKLELVKLPYIMIPKMIETVHFNNNKPENSNIALTNKREKIIKVYKEGKWQYCDKEQVLDELILRNYTRLDCYYAENCEGKLGDIFTYRYKQFQEKFDDNDKDLFEQIKKDSIMLLLNEKLKTDK